MVDAVEAALQQIKLVLPELLQVLRVLRGALEQLLLSFREVLELLGHVHLLAKDRQSWGLVVCPDVGCLQVEQLVLHQKLALALEDRAWLSVKQMRLPA